MSSTRRVHLNIGAISRSNRLISEEHKGTYGPWGKLVGARNSGAPISVEEHTSMVPRPRCQSQDPPLQESSAIPALPWPSKLPLRYSLGLAPTTRLNALLNAASDS